MMEIIPAIDLRNGKCVRLYQGDYSRETVFSDHPVAMAIHWQAQGATRLHLVDLDGAENGEMGNTLAIKEIVHAVQLPIQLGGGIRKLETVEYLLGLGIQRVILGTAAVENPSFVEEACRRFGEGIIISIDLRDNYVATHGWQEKTAVTASELVERMVVLGAKRFIYTDIVRDGTLTEPNYKVIVELLSKTSLPIIAAGGIATLSHLVKLAQFGVEGAIVGQGLYTGSINLKETLAALQ